MVADGLFGFLDRKHAQASEIPIYAYHFDQKSTLDGLYTGLAHHAIDIGYVFLNMKEQMTDGQRRIASKVAGDFLDFAYGREPWEQYNKRSRWMRYGPDDTCAMISEEEAEPVRKYSRMNAIVNAGIFENWVAAMDDLANRTTHMLVIHDSMLESMEKRFRQPVTYIEVIAVDPALQGKGVGSMVVQEILALAPARVPVVLESTSRRSVPFYQRFGFKEIGSAVLTPQRAMSAPDECTLWFMAKD
ncbi:hypothetical protein PLICBS_000112 [Purpureocillium lilacinum]|uniref:uncharacterized protein n=1 Tax=Purpureocillium lilacinum TaxID=33203 RepID=UPI00208764EC|nr:hypothetical protein PLICBS_000112 [Purpureocillium lilacinum]